jgi:hypothetical protein
MLNRQIGPQAGRPKDGYKQLLQGVVNRELRSIGTVMKRYVRRVGEEKIKPYLTLMV